MLDIVDQATAELRQAIVLLRGEIALTEESWREALFYMDTLLKGRPRPGAELLATRRSATAYLRQKDISSARESLRRRPSGNTQQLGELEKYVSGRDRNPLIGGSLGLLPGFGYAYSGEYANALRSLLLNGLFIYGMVDTAGDEEWGAFAAISFFELTWYTGSIYGGIDAAHRHNRDRLAKTLDAINGTSRFSVDLERIPVVSLKFQF